ncbi:hypothetical protein ACFL0G_05095 [Candidatus Zixiibacteriota bacterium]
MPADSMIFLAEGTLNEAVEHQEGNQLTRAGVHSVDSNRVAVGLSGKQELHDHQQNIEAH